MNDQMGQLFSVGAAVAWAFATIFFRRAGERVHPLGLNLFKGLFATALLIPTTWIFEGTVAPAASWQDYVLLLVSGMLGIGIADTLYLKSLNILGAGRSAIVICLYSPFIILLSTVFLGEMMSVWQLVGAMMIVTAVLAPLLEKRDRVLPQRELFWAIVLGALGQLANGVGIVMVKPLLDRSPFLWVSSVRMIGGVLAILMILGFVKERRKFVSSIWSAGRWGYTLAGSVTGAYLALMFWIAGMKYTQASLASALNQTSSIFIFLLGVFMLKEKATPIRSLGVLVAVAGALIIILS